MKYQFYFSSALSLFLLFSTMHVAQANQEVDKLLTLGQQASDAGNYEKAIGYYEKAVELDPNSAPVFNALGAAYQNLNAPVTDTVWFYKVALDIDPNDAEAYNNICRAYYQAEQADEAEKACQKALQISPTTASTKLTLAWVYLRLKQQPNAAIKYFEEVLKVGQSPAIYFGLGMAYAMRGDRGQALEIITKIRDMGNEEFAAQLENMVRATSQPAPQTQPATTPTMQEPIALPQRQSGTLVPGTIPPPSDAQSSGSSPENDGLMHVRLSGHLKSTTSTEQNQTPPSPAAQAPAAVPDHPGSLSGQESAPPQESAIDRIRRLRGFRGSSAHPTY